MEEGCMEERGNRRASSSKEKHEVECVREGKCLRFLPDYKIDPDYISESYGNLPQT